MDSGFGLTQQMGSGSHKDLEQSSQIGDNSVQSTTPSNAVRGRETTYMYSGTTDNGVSEETAVIVKGENIYSEIPPTVSQSGEGGGAAAMDSDLRSTREPVRGGQAEEEGGRELEETEAAATGVPPEEALYEQPVGQPNLCGGCNYFKLTTNCSCNCLQYKIYSPSKGSGLFM